MISFSQQYVSIAPNNYIQSGKRRPLWLMLRTVSAGIFTKGAYSFWIPRLMLPFSTTKWETTNCQPLPVESWVLFICTVICGKRLGGDFLNHRNHIAFFGLHLLVIRTKPSEGSFNKIFVLTMDNGRQAIALDPHPNFGVARFTTAPEVAAMHFLNIRLELPVARSTCELMRSGSWKSRLIGLYNHGESGRRKFVDKMARSRRVAMSLSPALCRIYNQNYWKFNFPNRPTAFILR